ncbi:N-acetyltransferase [Pedobacter sp. KBW06]|uniref:GNAT family N-acetyltransferase n=1 Tax=Pedobacter sp. KBW06 TaxID=2153359 RepID=UPI000F5B4EB6|nr:GNAT family N-acetyltransferase [Pedobacter sp. KBW06]RQO73884.1 N-acetyltransferase [Pedobacter sp. KBW06]
MQQDILKFHFDKLPVLESERLLLREQTLGDAAALFKIRSNDAVMKYIPRPKPKSIADIEALINEINENFLKHESLGWVITLKENPERYVGHIGYWKIDAANFRAEVGYLLDPEFWGQGIIVEALSLVTDFGFNAVGLHSICAVIDPENQASARALLKSGYVKEAHFKQDFYYNGQFQDTEIYCKVNA